MNKTLFAAGIILFVICGCGAERGNIVGESGDGENDIVEDSIEPGFDTYQEGDVFGYDARAEVVIDSQQDDVGIDALVDVVVDEGTSDVIEDGGEDAPVYVDSDGDTISDADEGNGMVDTDGDTIPDTEDTDSDGDGIEDSLEAGDDNPLSPPVDSDADTIADFRDQDSDGDTISDLYEGTGDADGDGIMNYRDLDSDGDFIPDYIEAGDDDVSTPPVDTDSDGTSDYLDLDSDNDFIPDSVESIEDTDSDTIPDYVDMDSDNDGVSDSDEAGDTDLSTPPQDCGDDYLPNYRDTDSDNDGVGDAEEISLGTDICSEDTDGDGVSDLVEITYGSDPRNSGDSPRTHGDFVFVVPYMESPDPTVDTLVFSTDIQHADVFFLMDTTGSMGGEIANLRSSLSGTIIPEINRRIPDTWYAVGGFDDYPVYPYGSASSGDRVFYLLQRTTSSASAAQNAVNRLTTHYGVDGPESHVPALYATATGNGLGSYLSPQTSCGAGEFGYPCFRSGAVPIVILFTDAPFHNGPGGSHPYSGISPAPPTYSQAVTELNNAHIKVIGINSGGSYGEPHLRQICNDTGSVDAGGTPLVFNISSNGSGLGTSVVDAIETLIHYVPIEVSTSTEDAPGDGVDATIFIDRIEPNTVGGVPDPLDPAKICVGGLAVADRTGDTRPDVFTSVLPGTTVCFDIYPVMNTMVAPLEVPQIFEAYIHVIGDGITVLDTRSVYFLVPPEISGGN